MQNAFYGVIPAYAGIQAVEISRILDPLLIYNSQSTTIPLRLQAYSAVYSLRLQADYLTSAPSRG